MSFLQPPDPPEDPRDDAQRWEDNFKLMEDERAEFEATFKDLHYDLTRTWANFLEIPECDYKHSATGYAWAGWLMHARVAWVETKK